MVAYLANEAKYWYHAIIRESPNISWADLQTEFLRDFSTPATSIQLFKTLSDAIQKKEERPFAFLMRIQSYCYDFNVDMPKSEVVSWCLKGLHRNIANTIRSNVPKSERTLSWLKSELREWSSSHEEEAQTRSYEYPTRDRNHVRPYREFPKRSNQEPVTFRNAGPRANNNDNTTHAKSRDNSTLICFNCNAKGHTVRECKMQRNDSAIAQNRRKFTDYQQGRSIQNAVYDTEPNTCTNNQSIIMQTLR